MADPVDTETGEVLLPADIAEKWSKGQGVHRAMLSVMTDLARTGIAKSRKNEQQGYAFRGIDEAYAAAAPLFARHGLLMKPHVQSREVTERMSGNNKALFYVVVQAEYEFISVEDGSREKVGPFFGEAMDSGDKATNKAMSAAHKYAIFETFVVPIRGMPDADADHHDVMARNRNGQQRESPPTDPEIVKRFDAAENMNQLQTVWNGIPQNERRAYATVKEEAKQRLAKR